MPKIPQAAGHRGNAFGLILRSFPYDTRWAMSHYRARRIIKTGSQRRSRNAAAFPFLLRPTGPWTASVALPAGLSGAKIRRVKIKSHGTHRTTSVAGGFAVL